jgi:hypothetical protein
MVWSYLDRRGRLGVAPRRVARAWLAAGHRPVDALAVMLVGSAVRALRDPESRTRYSEEWMADFGEKPAGWPRLRWAIGVRVHSPASLQAGSGSVLTLPMRRIALLLLAGVVGTILPMFLPVLIIPAGSPTMPTAERRGVCTLLVMLRSKPATLSAGALILATLPRGAEFDSDGVGAGGGHWVHGYAPSTGLSGWVEVAWLDSTCLPG